MTDREEFEKFLHGEGYTDVRFFDDVVYAAIAPFIFTFGIIIGQVGDRTGYKDRWCYHNYTAAKAALDAWDGTGEPQGWHRNTRTGRRRDEQGNEYVRY